MEYKVSVLLPLPLDKTYDYSASFKLKRGDLVHVPFGSKTLYGVVWTVKSKETIPSSQKLKMVLYKPDLPPLSQEVCAFIEWVSSYTMAPKGAVLKMALSVPDALKPPKTQIYYRPNLAALKDKTLSPPQEKIINLLTSEGEDCLSCAALAKKGGVSPSTVRTLLKQSLIEAVEIKENFSSAITYHYRPITFSESQQKVVKALNSCVEKRQFSVSVVDGVTGSGKTEVYFEVISKILERNQQALVLLPEISLSPQLMERFKDRFGDSPALWHSDLKASQRRKTWLQVLQGTAKIIVGARSALFLPYANLGLIVVDEEHEHAYKQEEGVTYHARDMAVTRAHLANIPVLLTSATPSLETLENCKNQKYSLYPLNVRHGVAVLPQVQLVDMRQSKAAQKGPSWISSSLFTAIEETLARQEQVLLFLNRRGYAPLTLCRQCGHRLSCPHCSSWIVEHRKSNKMLCHYCGFRQPILKKCTECEGEETFVPCGPGVERLEEEVRKKFQTARTAIMASDMVEHSGALLECIDKIQRKEIDIIIGTQMMAKGHHFPHLTLVGIVDADLGLLGGDLRACEKTYQLLHQVSGRAGREDRPGRVLIQTYQIDHPVIKALEQGQRDAFLEQEIESRKKFLLPPFGRLIALVFSSAKEFAVENTAKSFVKAAPFIKGLEVLGPAPAPIFKIRNQYRWRVLLKTPKNLNTQKILKEWLHRFKMPSQVRLQIDVDPYSFL
jgi:primosomal protein N' (replication factor Y)